MWQKSAVDLSSTYKVTQLLSEHKCNTGRGPTIAEPIDPYLISGLEIPETAKQTI